MDIEYEPSIPPMDPPEGRDQLRQHWGEAMWAKSEDSGWIFAALLRQEGSQFVIQEFRVFPGGSATFNDQPSSDGASPIPNNGVTASVVRNFRYGQFKEEAIRGLAAPQSFSEEGALDWHDLLMSAGFEPEDVTPQTAKPGRGRPRLPDEELAQVAYHYDEAIREQVKAPISHVADAIDDPNPDRVRQVVSKCRQRGFLTQAPAKGIPGGQITPKAIEIIKRLGVEKPQEEGDRK